ncbi:MAG: ECF-type sigma factor [Pseudomonadota bacterium]
MRENQDAYTFQQALSSTIIERAWNSAATIWSPWGMMANSAMSANVSSKSADVTRLLRAYAAGDSSGLDDAIPIVYTELQKLARAQLNRSNLGGSMQTTVLVHEAYEKLVVGKLQRPNDRRHFFAIASRAMRQIVVDTWRASNAAKRGGGVMAVPDATHELADLESPEELAQLEQAIEKLTQESPELAELIDLSCFAGLSNSEIATLHRSNVRTVQRNLRKARAWLEQFIGEQ